MIRTRLSEAEAARLEQAFRQTSDRKLRDRLQVIRLAQRGRGRQDIARDLGVSPRTAQRWLNAFLERGSDGLGPRKAPGGRAKIPERLADEVRRWVIEGPAAQGLGRANWAHAELADHLRKAHGIVASRSAVQRFCRRIGVRVYRPTYRYLRGDPAKQAKAREEVAELKRGPKRTNSCC